MVALLDEIDELGKPAMTRLSCRIDSRLGGRVSRGISGRVSRGVGGRVSGRIGIYDSSFNCDGAVV